MAQECSVGMAQSAGPQGERYTDAVPKCLRLLDCRAATVRSAEEPRTANRVRQYLLVHIQSKIQNQSLHELHPRLAC